MEMERSSVCIGKPTSRIDHYYQEKFYFTPGDTGFTVWDTRYGRIGVGICWDQWFPETARSLALKGADVILYPTAIGSEPILDCDSSGHWRRAMQGHAAVNIVPVAAANRFGLENVEPCPENAGQSSSLEFYGSSFITDETGAVLCQAGRDTENVLCARFDFEKIRRERLEMGAFQGSEARVVLELTRFRLVDGWGAHRKGIAGKRRKSICPA